MPCYPRERQKFEVWRTNKQEQRQKNESGFNFRRETDDEAAEMFARLKKKLDEHIRTLENLKRKLRGATSEEEKARLRKEIDALEKEIQGYEDTMEELTEFVREVERRTISLPIEKK